MSFIELYIFLSHRNQRRKKVKEANLAAVDSPPKYLSSTLFRAKNSSFFSSKKDMSCMSKVSSRRSTSSSTDLDLVSLVNQKSSSFSKTSGPQTRSLLRYYYVVAASIVVVGTIFLFSSSFIFIILICRMESGASRGIVYVYTIRSSSSTDW